MITRIVFFGSTTDSLSVLQALHGRDGYSIVGVVTQPPRPVGRDKHITPTPVQIWAQEQDVTVLSFASRTDSPWLYTDEQAVIDTLQPLKADLFISASYGQLIPWESIQAAPYGGINVHPSLLPRWRGADPLPWTILSNDQQTGVTIVTLSQQFDEGRILAQKKIPTPQDKLAYEIRAELFEMGALLLTETLPRYIAGDINGQAQDPTHATASRRVRREDGRIPWDTLVAALDGTDVPASDRPPSLRLSGGHITDVLTRAYRALHPWPGLWTTIPVRGQDKRVKLLEISTSVDKLIIDTVQMEGKSPAPFEQFKKAYLE